MATRSRVTTSRPRCGRFSPTWRRSSTRPGPNITSNSASSFRPSPAPSAPPTSSSASAARLRHRFQVRCRRARSRALPGRRRRCHQRAAAVLRRRRAPLAPRIFRRRRQYRSDDLAAGVDRARRRNGVVRRRSRTMSSTSSSRPIAPPARRRSRQRRAWSGATWCRFCPAKPICPAHTGPLLDLAQFMVPTPAAPPSKEAYCRLLADGLNLVDAVKDISTALHDQAKRALENGDIVPGYTLSAGRAERHWRDEKRRDRRVDQASVSPAMTSSPRRCARRNKSSFAQKRAASRFPQNSSFRAAPASRWCGARTHVPRCPDGTRSCGLSPRH